MVTEDEGQKVDDYHAEVYALGGGIVTTREGSRLLYAAVSLPGIVTKYEPIEKAMDRLQQWKRDRRGKQCN